jgi:hypothetical protein
MENTSRKSVEVSRVTEDCIISTLNVKNSAPKMYFKPILVYATKTWTLTKYEIHRIQATKIRLLRSVIWKTIR